MGLAGPCARPQIIIGNERPIVIKSGQTQALRTRSEVRMRVEADERRPIGARATHKLRLLLAAIKFEHTLFALPFAYLGMVLASRDNNGWPGLDKLIWITLAMAGARTVAMGLNRLVDASQ